MTSSNWTDDNWLLAVQLTVVKNWWGATGCSCSCWKKGSKTRPNWTLKLYLHLCIQTAFITTTLLHSLLIHYSSAHYLQQQQSWKLKLISWPLYMFFATRFPFSTFPCLWLFRYILHSIKMWIYHYLVDFVPVPQFANQPSPLLLLPCSDSHTSWVEHKWKWHSTPSKLLRPSSSVPILSTHSTIINSTLPFPCTELQVCTQTWYKNQSSVGWERDLVDLQTTVLLQVILCFVYIWSAWITI